LRRVLQSDIVHFSVGKNQKQFSIHQALESSFLRKALELAMIESINKEDFGRCCEFVYSGDYSALCPVRQSPGNDTSQSENRET
jgi:hypothetical protein